MFEIIILSQGQIAIVDSADYERVKNMAWYFRAGPEDDGLGYAVSSEGHRGKTVYLHRFIMGATKGQIVDHVNRDRLDCRRANMRLCTKYQNASNRNWQVGRNGYRGVHDSPLKGKPFFRACIKVQGKKYFGKRRTDAVQCARDYDEIALRHLGEFAVLNFPKPAVVDHSPCPQDRAAA